MMLASFKIYAFLFVILLSVCVKVLLSQTRKNLYLENQQIHVKGGSVVIFQDSIITVQRDTILVLPSNSNYFIRDLKDLESDSFYDSLRIRAKKRKLTKALYDALVVSQVQQYLQDQEYIKSENIYLPYEGKSIGRILLKKVRVLAGSVQDTSVITETSFSNLLNKMHVETRDGIIYNNLFFKEGEKLDAFELADNERILRALPYIEDAKIMVRPREDNSEIVDLIIVTKDQFSIGATPSFNSFGNYKFSVYDQNLVGFGTELRYTYFLNQKENPSNGHELIYDMTNIKGTFIGGKFNYANIFGEEFIGISFDKQFLTPQTRYAGALDAAWLSEFYEEEVNGMRTRNPYTLTFSDAWLGRSFLLRGEHSRKNLIITGRYRWDEYGRRPFVNPDSNWTFQNNRLYLASMTFREINYIKSSHILSFGVTEDIPIGLLMSLTGGLEQEEFAKKPYFGLEISRAEFYEGFGYLSLTSQFGGFIYKNRLQEGVFRFLAIHYSYLVKLKEFRYRQLVSFNFTHGIRRLPGELIDLKDQIRGFSSDKLKGTSKITLSLESVFFTPWNFYGFRFAVYGFADFGFLGDDYYYHFNELYGVIGIGFRIRNESLVFRTVLIRVGFFPRTPGDVNNWRFDFSATDPSVFRTLDYGKPLTIGFR